MGYYRHKQYHPPNLCFLIFFLLGKFLHNFSFFDEGDNYLINLNSIASFHLAAVMFSSTIVVQLCVEVMIRKQRCQLDCPKLRSQMLQDDAESMNRLG